MKLQFETQNNKLNLLLVTLVIFAIGLGCGNLGGTQLENTTWKGVVVDPQSSRSFPISVDLLPDGKAYFNITLPNSPQPVTGSAKWSKAEKKVSATWGSGEQANSFEGTVVEDQINGTVSNAKGSVPVTLTKEKK